jgi:hypothetical protein
MYPSRRQSPGSGVGLDRGAGGGLTGIDAAIPTKVEGRGAAVPTGVDRTRGGVAEGSIVGVEFEAVPVPDVSLRGTLTKTMKRTTRVASAAAPI